MSINVLLADDSVPAQNMGKKILLDAGYAVVTVNNGLEALRKIAEAAPDVAILDIFMPGYTGLEICKRLRATAATASIPVILTVGKMEPYRPEEGESVKSNAVIVKPFAAAELIAAVKSLIGAPSTVVAVQPKPGAEFQAAKPAAEDPLQDYLAAEGVVFPAPLAADQAGVPVPPEGAPQEETADEPLFFAAPSVMGEGIGPREPSVYGGEHILSGAESDGETSLAFDPNATHTPFSASSAASVDLLPAASDSDSGHGMAAFTEFDLEPETPFDASMPGLGKPIIDGPSPAALDATGQAGLVDSSGPEVTAPEFLVNSHEMVSGPLGAAELESSSLDVPALDPLLKVSQAPVPPSMLSWNSLDVGEVPTQIDPDITATSVGSTEEISAPAVVPPPSPEEEARRAAFEALFNSDEIPPLEEIPVLPSLSAPAVLPSISDLSKDYSFHIKPDAELEVLGDDSQQHFLDPGLDPNLVEEGQAEDGLPSTIGTIPDRDPLLDDALPQAGWQKIGSLQELDKTNALTTSAMYLPQVDASDDLVSSSAPETASAEALPKIDDEPANPLEPAYPGEIAQTAPETEPEPPVVCPEAVIAEARTAEPEHTHAGTEIRIAEATLVSVAAEAAVLLTKPASAPAEVEPERDEATPLPAEVAPESVPDEAAAVEQASPRPDQHLTGNPSSSAILARSNDAERVHQAVERVFERFKPLLIAAIVRELARSD